MLKHIFSIKIAVLVLFMFGAIVGGATFIENDYGTQTAQALIYNAEVHAGKDMAMLRY